MPLEVYRFFPRNDWILSLFQPGVRLVTPQPIYGGSFWQVYQPGEVYGGPRDGAGCLEAHGQ
eukprot:2271797-Pyramimonas_sp.AAC.2